MSLYLQTILNVNTQNLDYIDDNTNTPGIVRPNPDLPEGQYDWRTVEANNGVLRVLTYNLDRATQEVVGVVKPEGITTLTDVDGSISVRTAGLDKASYIDGVMTYGIVRPDNYTIETNIPGVLYANAEHMTPTAIDTEGNPHFGVIKLDPVSFGIDTANTTYVNRYPEIVSLLDRYLGDYTYIMNWLIDHENRITALEHQNVEMIASFNNYGTSITELDVPVWDPVAQVVHSEEKYYSVQFSIVTNCKFHISVEYQNNVAPGITLHQVKMGDNTPVSGSGLSNFMFESTNMNENTLNFEFLCNNYTSLTNEGNTPTTVFITVSSINDASVYKTGAHVFNRWNMEWFKEPIVPDPVVTYETRYEYYVEHDGTQNKDLYFVVPSGDNKYEITYSQSMNSQTTMSSYSFYIMAEESMAYRRKKFVDKYVDGELSVLDTTGTVDISYNVPFKNYISLSMLSNSRTSYTLMPSLETFSRNAMVDGDSDGWINDNISVDAQTWVSYYMRNIASNTATVENRAGHNIFDVMSISPISVNDRMAKIKLDINHNSGDYSSWKNTQLTINYIEDIKENNINVFVQSTIPTIVTRTNQNSSTIELLNLHITRTNNVALNSTWGVNIQYCFNTILGSSRTNTDITDETSIISSSDITTIENIRTATDSDRENYMNSSSNFSRIKINIPAGEDDVTISIKSNGGINKPEGVTITKYEDNSVITSNTVNYLVPQTVFDHIGNSDIENIFSSFKIVNCTINGDNFAKTTSIVDGEQVTSARVTSGINWQSIGTWPTYVQQNVGLTFGDAYISNIHIYPWDDTEMHLEFNIMAGLMTNIPAGAPVTFVAPYSNIWPNVVLFNGSNSYDYDDFYDNIVISMDGGWNPMGTKISIRLRNLFPVAPNPNSHWTVIAKTNEVQTEYIADRFSDPNDNEINTRFATTETTVYTNGNGKGMSTQNIVSNSKINNTNTRGTDNQNLTQHQTTSSNGPLVQNITGIMFNFVLSANANGQTTTLYFAASSGLLTDKVYITANYNNGASKNVNIINGLLNYTPSIVSNESTNTVNQETLDTLTYMYNQINEMNEVIQGLASGRDDEEENDSPTISFNNQTSQSSSTSHTNK